MSSVLWLALVSQLRLAYVPVYEYVPVYIYAYIYVCMYLSTSTSIHCALCIQQAVSTHEMPGMWKQENEYMNERMAWTHKWRDEWMHFLLPALILASWWQWVDHHASFIGLTLMPNWLAGHPVLLACGLKPQEESLIPIGDVTCGIQTRESKHPHFAVAQR